jgi:hypothetical protein
MQVVTDGFMTLTVHGDGTIRFARWWSRWPEADRHADELRRQPGVRRVLVVHGAVLEAIDERRATQ